MWGGQIKMKDVWMNYLVPILIFQIASVLILTLAWLLVSFIQWNLIEVHDLLGIRVALVIGFTFGILYIFDEVKERHK